MAMSIYLDSLTGDYVESNGDILNKLITLTICYTRIAAPLKRWLYSEIQPDFGSNMYRLTTREVAGIKTPIAGEKMLFQALSPMLSLGEIKNLVVKYVGIGQSGQWKYKITAQTIAGTPLEFFYPPNEVINAS